MFWLVFRCVIQHLKKKKNSSILFISLDECYLHVSVCTMTMMSAGQMKILAEGTKLTIFNRHFSRNFLLTRKKGVLEGQWHDTKWSVAQRKIQLILRWLRYGDIASWTTFTTNELFLYYVITKECYGLCKKYVLVSGTKMGFSLHELLFVRLGFICTPQNALCRQTAETIFIATFVFN